MMHLLLKLKITVSKLLIHCFINVFSTYLKKIIYLLRAVNVQHAINSLNFDPLYVLMSHEPLLNRSYQGMYYHVLTASPSTSAVFNKA